VPIEQAADVLDNTKRWMVHLLSEDVRLMQELQRTILRRASISVKVLPDPPKGSDAEKQLDQAESQNHSTSEPTAPVTLSETVAAVSAMETPAIADSEQAAAPVGASGEVAAAGEVVTEAIAGDAADVVSSETVDPATADGATPASTDIVAPLIAEFHQGRKQGKGLKTKSLSDKQLSPRQRRRKWLRSILESYAKLRKPLSALTPYQILMLSRGQRSQIIAVQFHYEEKPLVQVCRESLCPGRHPMHQWLVEIAEEGLRSHILPRLHQDVFAILEEDAHTDLTEAAVVHLQASLLQRPVRGHRILVIDAIGPKMAAVAIVDAEGNVVFTNEIACNSNRADVVAQNVVALGQWIHEHQVTLLALSNGPARRYLIHTVSELLKQSADGSLYWTMVDRAGADGYCMSRGCLVELPKISRRHRAATWLAWRLQDPLKQILKVDPVRLRLGSYQRELPQRELESALQDAVSAAITQAGVDVFHVNADVLKRIPGMTSEAAKAVVLACQEDRISSRESLMLVLKEHLSEMNARQAIGFIKVFGSETTLDGTIVHPDDYRLAERLVAHASLPLPANAPENWSKPDYASLAAANEAAAIEHAKQSVEDTFAASIDLNEPADSDESVQDANGDASVSDESTEEVAVVEPVADTAESESESGQSAESASSTENATDAPVASEAAESTDAAVVADDSAAGNVSESAPAAAARATVPMPVIPTTPMERPTLSIDVERLARSWQVGREKMKRVANCLQFPFADARDFQYPLPLLCKVPRLDSLQSGMMLQALVIGVADFGVFVDLGPECSGLIHISRLAPDFIEDPHQFVQVGDLVPVWVLNVDEKKKRVSLTAIPPGTPSRRTESQNSEGNQGGQNAPAGRDQRNQRNDRPQGGPRSGNADGRSQGGARPQAGPRTGQGAGGGDRNRGPSSDNRGRGDGRGDNRGGNRGGRDGNRGRNQSEQGDSSSSRRPARVEPPKPVTPISDAMQQGKEPLRSFSDLLQFMKVSRDEPAVEQVAAPKVEEKSPPVESAKVSDSVESTENTNATDPSA
jgi:transcriptional accessory protein Tex/SPT6